MKKGACPPNRRTLGENRDWESVVDPNDKRSLFGTWWPKGQGEGKGFKKRETTNLKGGGGETLSIGVTGRKKWKPFQPNGG